MNRKGIEPLTRRLRVCCSTSWANGPYFIFASGGARTPDQRIRSPPLYPTELRTHFLRSLIDGWTMGFEPTTTRTTIWRSTNWTTSTMFIMRQRRIELLTHSLEGCCSIQLSYWRKSFSGWRDSNPRSSGPKPDAMNRTRPHPVDSEAYTMKFFSCQQKNKKK